MPAVNGVHTTPSASEPRPYFVLVTGFGPFSRHVVNPSWLAVEPLHNTVMHVEVPADPVPHDDPRNPSSTPIPVSYPTTTHREIRITSLNVPVIYDDVLSIVPGLHAHPPVLPLIENAFPPPPNGYDLVLHVGVAGRGPLRIERTSHKFGYNMKDANGCPCAHRPCCAARLGYDIESPIDGGEPPKRGFGKGYESFPEEIYTDVDVEKLVHHLKKCGVEQVYSSLDAGHYLCDFIYYCSLAESRRSVPKTDKPTTKVLFIHCPPADQPLSTEEVTEAVKKSIVWLCTSPS
ncbi:hypothetical protein HD554DRAFT_2204358 [Boletus coccyginus]|nr:hypothetical protein HD554DRAFT_2204358 [Boletus coccyginus]